MSYKEKIKKNWDLFFIVIICFLSFIIMMKYADKKSMWLDELYQISYIQLKYSILESLKIYVKLIDVSPPFFAMVSYIWYRIVPYGDKWLYLLPIMATIVGIFIIGMTGRKAYNKRVGIFCSLFAAITTVTYLDIGLQFRQYGFLYLVSAICLYNYVKRYREGDYVSKKRIFFYGIAIALLPYTHYLSVLICFALFLADFFLYLRKKVSFRFIYSYLIGGALFLPWGILVIRYKEIDISEFWPEVPKLTSMIRTIWFLMGNNEQVLLFLLLSISVVAGILLFSFKNKSFDYKRYYLLAVSLWVTIFMISIIFIYSKFIVPEGSLYVDRYFIPLLPFLYLIMGWTVDKICNYINTAFKFTQFNNSKMFSQVIITLSLILMIGSKTFENIDNDSSALYEPYREAAIWLREQEDIYNKDTIVILSNNLYIVEGWTEHYLTERGKFEAFDVCSGKEKSTIKRLKKSKYKRIYLVEMHRPVSKSIKKYIDKNYVLTEDREFNIKIYDK